LGDRDAVVSGDPRQCFGKKFTSTTVHKGVYAFIFDQKGLMGGVGMVGLEGSKITKITPDK
jgi:hypothetical protein